MYWNINQVNTSAVWQFKGKFYHSIFKYSLFWLRSSERNLLYVIPMGVSEMVTAMPFGHCHILDLRRPLSAHVRIWTGVALCLRVGVPCTLISLSVESKEHSGCGVRLDSHRGHSQYIRITEHPPQACQYLRRIASTRSSTKRELSS